MATSLTVIEVFIGVVGTMGTITNSVSLSYFIDKIKSNSRISEGPTLRLFILLNIFDLMVCIMTFGVFIAFHIPYDHNISVSIALRVFKVCVFTTGFLTSLLAIVRAISVASPLYVVNLKAIYALVLIYIVIVLVLERFYNLSTGSFVDDYITERVVLPTEFLILTWIFILVIGSNVLCITKLYQSKSQSVTWKRARKAVITVVIISVLFCLCNIASFVVYGLGIFFSDIYRQTHRFHLEILVNFLLLPLNSACNPAVYFMRKADMRAHVTEMRRKLAGFGMCRKERDASTTPQ